MADNKKALKSIRKGVAGTARSSPAIAAAEGIAKVGDKVIEKTPEGVRDVVRKTARKVGRFAEGAKRKVSQRLRIMRHQAMRKANRRSR